MANHSDREQSVSNSANPCPICRKRVSPAQPGSSHEDEPTCEVVCTTCGSFRVQDLALKKLHGLDEDTRRKLTWVTRHRSESGPPLTLTLANIDAVADSVAEPHPPNRKMDLLLQCLAGRTLSGFGTDTTLTTATDWPVAYARSQQELEKLRDALVEAKWIRTGASGTQLTPDG